MPAWSRKLEEFLIDGRADVRPPLRTVAQPPYRLDPPWRGGDGHGDAAGRAAAAVSSTAPNWGRHRWSSARRDCARRWTRSSPGMRSSSRSRSKSTDHETIRLMVQQGRRRVRSLPHSSVSNEVARGRLEAHRITETGIFRTLALGVRASRNASQAPRSRLARLRSPRRSPRWRKKAGLRSTPRRQPARRARRTLEVA